MGNPSEPEDRGAVAVEFEPPASLDLRGLRCPLPVLKTRRALLRLEPGRTLEVRCTDPLASLDIPHLVRETGDMLLSVRAGSGETRFRIRRAAPAAAAAEDPSGGADVDTDR